MPLINWIKKNKLASGLILIVAYFLFRNYFYGVSPLGLNVPKFTSVSSNEMGFSPDAAQRGIGLGGMPVDEFSPSPGSERMVVQESNLSLVVKNVRESVDKAIEYSQSQGGYMVSSSLSQPEEAPYATLTLRIPSKSLKTSLEYLRSLAFKVSSENLYGNDVTDEYVDIEARLVTLNKTKAKFEEILNQANEIQDILAVQRELINLQSQIDSLKGREQYLQKTAEMAKITLYLSTDEYVLPYAPATPFRPAVIFKYAVRSLVTTLRGFVKLLIWVVVYAVVWLPVLLVLRFFSKRKQRKDKIAS